MQPVEVQSVTITPNSITVQWREVECLGRNGVITGYTVQVLRNGGVEETVEVGGNVQEATVPELTPSTTNSVQVAAVNSVGTGPFTGSIFFQTEGECLQVLVGQQMWKGCFLLFFCLPVLVVGLERASYTVPESVEAVEICITAVGTNTSTQSFQVTF